MLRRPLRSLVPSLLAGLLLGSAVAASPAAAADPKCPHRAHELTRSGGGILYASGGSLTLCTAYYGDPPVTRRIGPWGSSSKLAFDGSQVLWTVREHGFYGKYTDRIWAANGPKDVWLRGVSPTTGGTANVDLHVRRLTAYGEGGAWVTTQGSVMAAVREPDVAPAGVGAATAGALAPVVPGVTDTVPPPSKATALGFPQGLRSVFKPLGHRVLIGRWSALAQPAFADTLKVRSVGGDGDECGGVDTLEFTVKPLASAPRVGATWDSGWTSSSLACS